MKRITNWIKKQYNNAAKWCINKLVILKIWCIKWLTITAFKIAVWSRKHAQANYDRNVFEMVKGMSKDGFDEQITIMYKFVRRKQAFVFKTKIMNGGKHNKHFKILLIETPGGIIEVDIIPPGHEDYKKHDYINKIGEDVKTS